MNSELVVLCYIIAVGLTCSGLVVNGYELMTSRRASFSVDDTSMLKRLAGASVILLGGPNILLRSALQGLVLDRRAVPFLFACFLIITCWSFTSGLFVLHVALSM